MTAELLSDLLATLPPEWPDNLLPVIQDRIAASPGKVVVLDDDPTGTQTVHGVAVLAEWSVDRLCAEFADARPCFYILTNSRSIPLAQAQALNAEIGRNLVAASHRVGVPFVVVSRSDSTLRGHFPGELDALIAALDEAVDATLIIPFFLEGGRYTIDDVHYMAEGDLLIPVGQTPYARDASFGYAASNLRDWVAEKTNGRVGRDEVERITLGDIRQGGWVRVAERLARLERGATCVVNAASYRDLEVFVLGLLNAEASGKRFVYRTAASFVRVRAGIGSQPLLTLDDLQVESNTFGGLFVIGSYVPRSTRQFEALRQQAGVTVVELDVTTLLDARRQQAMDRAVAQVDEALTAGHDTVLVTTRQLVTGTDAEASLAIGRCVSDSLIAILRTLDVQPRYLVAKGGITASDVATKGLGVKRAEVLGQILPGVPVWRLGSESRYPGAPYIVFPGNVGDDNALVTIRAALRAGV